MTLGNGCVNGYDLYLLRITLTIVFLIQQLLNNGSVYLHTYMLPKGWSPNPEDKGKYGKLKTIHKVKREYYSTVK